MTNFELSENLTSYLNKLRTDDLLSIHREFCSAANYYYDDELFSMDDFDELVSGWKPLELSQRIFYGDFNPNDDFFYFNGYGNLMSTNYPATLVSIPDIVDYIVENGEDLCDDGIREMLDEYCEDAKEEV